MTRRDTGWSRTGWDERSRWDTAGGGTTGPDDGRSDAEVESELRILLQRAAPDLPAPADRMERIRERAARSRSRRRAAALAAGLTTGLAAAALAAAPALAPGHSQTALPTPARTPAAVGGLGTAAGPGAATSAPPVPSLSPSPTPARTPGRGADPDEGAGGTGTAPAGTPPPSGTSGSFFPERAIRFPELDSLVISLPPGWAAMYRPAAKPLGGVGYLADQPLEPGVYCAGQGATCAPLAALADGGSLVTVTLVTEWTEAQKVLRTALPPADTQLDKTCALRGGTRELVGHRTIEVDDAVTVVRLSACLNQPSAKAVQVFTEVLDSVQIGGDAVDAVGTGTG
ncbi:hypothetical protein [Kitasatospora sp. A2-31]|uniref:hypothetical protein n=1 Tax=Kitasatospora sp. A2-31 TaxID=2916414 RepID=UPI001EEAD827|nr:hypothetical protein [Kitasatospora sp. A2-31]MCG6493847.1 hypothetical protein [Kitasatospora sp. A2-31]